MDLSLHLPRPTAAGAVQGLILPTWSPTIARSPHSIEINFPNRGEFPYLLLPMTFLSPLYPISLYLEETPRTKNQPPEAKTKPGSPSASLSLPGESSVGKKKKNLLASCLYRGQNSVGKWGSLCTKAAYEAESRRLLVFHAALFILKEELNSCKKWKLVFVFNFRKSVRFPGQSWGGGWISY